MQSTPDILIVGAGVVGAAIAYQAARGGLNTQVIDHLESVSAPTASWASAGGLRTQGREPAEAQASAAAMQRWSTLSDELDADLQYRAGGTLQVAETDEEAVEVKAHVDTQHANGLHEVSLLNRDEVFEIAPGAHPNVVAGSYAPTDGQANPILTTEAFARAARRWGARFHTGEPVVALLGDGDRIDGARTPSARFSAGTVVLAAGVGSRRLAATVGLHLPVRPMALQMLQTHPAPAGRLRPVLGGMRRALSLKQLDDGTFLIGGGWPADIQDATAGLARLVPERVTSNWRDACAVFPEMAHHVIKTSWYGFEAESIDALPFLGAIPGWSGLLMATGFSGHGFALAPIVGEFIVNEVLADPQHVDVQGLRAARMLDIDADAVRRFVSGETPSNPSAG